jgi:23S rRNA pseudouridine1911/1915/1917 synthase
MGIMAEDKIKVIYEDGDLVVVDKPAGWVTSRENKKRDQRYLEDWVRKAYPNHLPRGGIVHRLDKGTSGTVMVAKNRTAWDSLRRQLRNREVRKSYLALVVGEVAAVGGVEMPIVRSKHRFARWQVGVGGKKAKTSFKVIKKYRDKEKILSLVEVETETGRTHQIRVHFNFLGWSLLGDEQYSRGEVLRIGRVFLHASQIVFKLPTSGRRIRLKSNLPADLVQILAKYEMV